MVNVVAIVNNKDLANTVDVADIVDNTNIVDIIHIATNIVDIVHTTNNVTVPERAYAGAISVRFILVRSSRNQSETWASHC